MVANWKKKKVEIYPGPTSMVVIWIKKNMKILRESNPRPTSMVASWKGSGAKKKGELILPNPGPTSMAAIWKRNKGESDKKGSNPGPTSMVASWKGSRLNKIKG